MAAGFSNRKFDLGVGIFPRHINGIFRATENLNSEKLRNHNGGGPTNVSDMVGGRKSFFANLSQVFRLHSFVSHIIKREYNKLPNSESWAVFGDKDALVESLLAIQQTALTRDDAILFSGNEVVHLAGLPQFSREIDQGQIDTYQSNGGDHLSPSLNPEIMLIRRTVIWYCSILIFLSQDWIGTFLRRRFGVSDWVLYRLRFVPTVLMLAGTFLFLSAWQVSNWNWWL